MFCRSGQGRTETSGFQSNLIFSGSVLEQFQGDCLKEQRPWKRLPASRGILNSRLHDSVWSLTDWFWCICRFIGGAVQIEVITSSWAEQTLLRDWFIFSCEGRSESEFWGEAADSSVLFLLMQSSLLLCCYLGLLEMRRTFQHGYEFLLLSGSKTCAWCWRRIADVWKLLLVWDVYLM